MKEHAAKVQEQFEAEEADGMMVQMTLEEALERYGADLIIAATGAIAKKSSDGEVQVIFDGLNGVLLNHEIKVRDQIRFPAAKDNFLTKIDSTASRKRTMSVQRRKRIRQRVRQLMQHQSPHRCRRIFHLKRRQKCHQYLSCQLIL